MSRFIHELPDWPSFRWDEQSFVPRLAGIHLRRGKLLASMESLGFDMQQEAVLSAITEDVQKSSEIEGEHLDTSKVRSSIARRLGLEIAGLVPSDRQVDGVVEMMLDATQRFDASLTKERILGWHASLFPTGWSGVAKVQIGNWRDESAGPMQVVSGPIGRQKVHFEAPDAARLESETRAFLHWFNARVGDPLVRAAVAHLWFLTLHPLDDGNGRIGRAIMDMALAQADGTPKRFYSVSAQIQLHKESYYEVLERTQRGTLEITQWLSWFLERFDDALTSAEGILLPVSAKRRFWEYHAELEFNERQLKVINLLLDGLKGKLHTEKYAKLTKCSPRTALRDLSELVENGVLMTDPESSGRSTNYLLVPVD